MATDSHTLRAERFVEIGELIQRDAGIVLQRWLVRAAQEQPQAARVHREVLLDKLTPTSSYAIWACPVWTVMPWCERFATTQQLLRHG